MRSKRKKIIIICSTILFLFIGYLGWEYYKFHRAYTAQWEGQFKEAKKRLFDYRFSGEIIKKEYFEKSSLSYILTIKLDSSTLAPESSSFYYYGRYGYYWENRTIEVAVSKTIYENSLINDTITKKNMSDSIYINHKPYLLLNKEPLKWIPETK